MEFLNFVQYVRLEREGMEEPTIVHCRCVCLSVTIIIIVSCSAGIGRTGVLMAMETALCMLECMEPVNPLDIVRVMRNQRGMLVQTPVSGHPLSNNQYHLLFIWQAQYKFVCESILRAYEGKITCYT